jgi:hypothetical protein
MKRIAIAAVAVLLMTGCGGRANPLPGGSAYASSALAPTLAAFGLADETSILKLDKKQVVIGSTIDPKYHQLNPYGLAVASKTSGHLTKGDLVVCNFNDKQNVQGTGFTVVALHPAPGSKARLIVADKKLTGCAALALDNLDTIWATAFSANDDVAFSTQGVLQWDNGGKPFDRPWGQAGAPNPHLPDETFYESNAANGAILKVVFDDGYHAVAIAKGFAVNHGKPGSIFAPAGLTYDRKGDVLYIADGTDNTVVAFSKVSTIKSHGIVVEAGGKTFEGPDASHARLVFSGSPLNGPISMALLPNHNLVIGNTGNASGTNLMVEITPAGKLLATRNVDKGAAGALFGIVASGKTDSDTKIYFNDDNDNDLQVLER